MDELDELLNREAAQAVQNVATMVWEAMEMKHGLNIVCTPPDFSLLPGIPRSPRKYRHPWGFSYEKDDQDD